SGRARWRHEVQGVFGEPVASAGMVMVPWERQNIAILEGATGVEIARLRSTDDVVAWMEANESGIYYGSRGIYRLDDRASSGTRAGSTFLAPPLTDLPRQPETIAEDGFVPRPGARSARGRIRIYFRPDVAPEHAIQVVGETYYFVYYRYVFAFSTEGALRWTRILEQDVINAQPLEDGLLTVGEQGSLRVLDRTTGNDRWQANLDAQLASVAVHATGLPVPEAEAAQPRPLRSSLNEIVLDPDNRLVAARAYAVTQLANIDDPEVTRDLLDLYQQRSMPGALKEALREALRSRRSGEQFLLAALERRYDYLEDTQAPPLEAIVPALLEMRQAAAVPRLVNHLMDHETPDAVLPVLVRAIVQLGGAEAVPALRTFLV
ncbi:MAG: hypothetical protein K8H88_26785, partial [Sandaracinaceae bacterium]|nr:hypothetical protein [Sandaracinaceae bacterium]